MKGFFALLMLVPALAWGTIYNTDSDPTAAEVQTLINAMVDGDTLIIADGEHSWTSKVTINGKGITVQGGGGGKIIGQSRTTHDWTTGTKSFTMYSAGGEIDTSALSFTPGETIRCHYPVKNDQYLEGTVTSYVDPVLTLEITTANGSGGTDGGTDLGDENFWIVLRPPVTKLLRNYQPSTGDGFFDITEDDDTSVVIEDIQFERQSGNNADLINVQWGGEPSAPVIFRRCSFWMDFSNGVATRVDTNRGLFTQCSWNAGWDRDAGPSSSQALNMDVPVNASWTSVSTMGDADPDGLSNLYIEDSYFFAFRETATDTDDNARLTLRHNIFDHSSLGGHGQDTSQYGMRHVEAVYCKFLYMKDGSGREYNIANNWVHWRGGTGVIAYCRFEDHGTTSWGPNSTWRFQIQMLTRSGGLHGYGCWSAGDSETVYPASGYPYPRQVGYGYVDGSGPTLAGGYAGDSEPIWIWGLTGLPSGAPGNPGQDFGQCTNPDSWNAYVLVDTDGDLVEEGDIIYNGAADVGKPGYAMYTYPHPLARATVGASYGGRLRFNGTGSEPVLTDGTGSVPIKTD